ncbi:tyrosine-type recombinase/integrase [Kribbella sp. NBC_00359]|uniref:tyrosine-type recombinase/integrase n=1 Tax=Kribbella sp. NBC_00359 TaxID=2975966 RepID=UPI002E204172
MADRRSGERQLALSTLRANAGAVRAFCSYVTESRYGWVPFCEQTFADVPAQVVFDWNAPRHSTDDAVPPRRRSLTKKELQAFVDAADDIVDEEFARGSKRWLPALRDSIAFKIAYAYGLRRRELAMLEYVDFGPNPHVPSYGRFGAVQVRWAKGTRGSGPRRRTVLTVPEFDWVVPLLEFWLSPDGRERFPTADRSALLWPSERADGSGLRNFDRAFQRIRRRAELPEELTLHALRHSYVTHLIEAGYDPLFVQQQVGHGYSSTTALYTSVSSDFKQKTVQRMIARRLRSGDTSDRSGS